MCILLWFKTKQYGDRFLRERPCANLRFRMDYEEFITRAKERDVQQLIAAAGDQGSRKL